MGLVKNWLMEMQEYAYDCLERDLSWEDAKQEFLLEYPGQEQVFNNVHEEMMHNIGAL